MDKNMLPPGVIERLDRLGVEYVPADPANPPRVAVYCNLCEHEIKRHGNDWRCVANPPCRCLMMGCVPKVWSNDAD